MSTTMDELTKKIEKTLSVLKEDLSTIRAGRATPALIDKISADYYGVQTPLKNLSNISIPDPRTILIAPFDPKSIQNIEKAINIANIGINPQNDGKVIRLLVPQVTEERRKELVKTVKKMGEESKVAVRNVRRDTNDWLKKQEKASEITEDDLKNELEEVQKKTDKAIKDIEEILAAKEKDIMEV